MSAAALGRIKRAVRAAIGFCGGVDGAGATSDRSRTTAGDWNSLSSGKFPPLDCALAMDEVAVAAGHRPPLLHAFAGELGFAVIALPDGPRGGEQLGLMLMDVVTETGELAARVRAALDDGVIDGLEPAEIEKEADDLMLRAAAVRSYARDLQGKRSVAFEAVRNA